MLPDDVRGRIGDMVEAIAKIRAYVTGHDSTSFASDGKVRDAVVWNLAVLGEAARSIPDDLVEANPQIPWRKMRALRNLLIHQYFGISDAIVWARPCSKTCCRWKPTFTACSRRHPGAATSESR